METKEEADDEAAAAGGYKADDEDASRREGNGKSDATLHEVREEENHFHGMSQVRAQEQGCLDASNTALSF